MRYLKGPQDTAREQFMRFSARDVLAVKDNRPGIRRMDAGDNVEECGFPCTVRADQSGDAPLFNRQRSVFNGVDAAEVLTEVLNIQQSR